MRVLLAAVLTLGPFAASSLAQAASKQSAPAESQEAAAFREFIVQHPVALAELKKDSSLVSKPAFYKDHLVVGEYISAHPKVKEIVKADPNFFVNLTATTPGGQHGKKKKNGEKKQ
jgi:3-deoxy-D-manno-octulosonic-acid transferase